MMDAKKQDPHEKSHLASKKFVAFLVVELGLFALMGMMIYQQDLDTIGENTAFMVLAVTAGFVAVGYILGQTSLDRYVRVAQITMGNGDPAPLPDSEEFEDELEEDEGE